MRQIRDVMGGAIERAEVLRAARAQRVLRRWNEVVGEELAKRSWPDRYERGTVWVAVKGSAWASELRLMKERILKGLDELAGERGLFEDVRFGDRTVREGLEPAEPPEEPSEPKRSDVSGLSIREIAERRLRQWEDEGGA
ncbi:MAG: DUF721 domain-containing protein [Fimbriimonadaceae bacterium]|nr:DUF721 domain-containing protein [Fimbriimonadaceae bacterium]